MDGSMNTMAERDVAPDERALEQAHKQLEEYAKLASHHACEHERFTRLARSKNAEIEALGNSAPIVDLDFSPRAPSGSVGGSVGVSVR